MPAYYVTGRTVRARTIHEAINRRAGAASGRDRAVTTTRGGWTAAQRRFVLKMRGDRSSAAQQSPKTE